MEWLILGGTILQWLYFALCIYAAITKFQQYSRKRQMQVIWDLKRWHEGPVTYIQRSYDEAGAGTRALYLLRYGFRGILLRVIYRLGGRTLWAREPYYHGISPHPTKRPVLIATSVKMEGKDKALE